MDSQGQALLWEHLSLFQQDCHCGELCEMGLCCGEMLSPSQPVPAQLPPWGSCILAVLGNVLYALLSESLWEKTDSKLSPVPIWIDSKSTGQ